jgi:hypothetical protein
MNYAVKNLNLKTLNTLITLSYTPAKRPKVLKLMDTVKESELCNLIHLGEGIEKLQIDCAAKNLVFLKHFVELEILVVDGKDLVFDDAFVNTLNALPKLRAMLIYITPKQVFNFDLLKKTIEVKVFVTNN